MDKSKDLGDLAQVVAGLGLALHAAPNDFVYRHDPDHPARQKRQKTRKRPPKLVASRRKAKLARKARKKNRRANNA